MSLRNFSFKRAPLPNSRSPRWARPWNGISSSGTSIENGSGPLSTIQFLLYPLYGGTKDSVTLKGKKKMSETCYCAFFGFPGQKSLCCFRTAQKQGRAPSAGQISEQRVSNQSSWGGGRVRPWRQAKKGTGDSPQSQNLKGFPPKLSKPVTL